jgi:sodium/bile acid cotransporter 7
MAIAVALAWLFPDPGAPGGWLHPELLTKLGVALIFFLHGVSLSFAALREGTMRWPLHLVVQSCTFVAFPLVGLALLWLVGARVAPDLALGFFFLCALPSTVSSSVALTAAARGNVPAAVFNATLSSLIGVFVTPLWIGWMLKSGGTTMPMGDVVLDLVKWLVMPLVAGQLLRPLLGAWAARNKKRINVVDRLTILLLVYTSFCDSVKRGVWSSHGPGPVLATIAGSLILFWIIFTVASLLCDALRFTPPDRIAAVFCGSKKTLASGVPMAQLIFAGRPGMGLILLPIMIYHPLQLLICGALANRWARREE